MSFFLAIEVLWRALGATQRDIRRQFLNESVVVSLTGGILGLFIGIGAGWGMDCLADWKALFSLSFFVIPLAFSVATGLFFWLYPALKASKLNPAKALRHA